jgi:hypothetical protein
MGGKMKRQVFNILLFPALVINFYLVFSGALNIKSMLPRIAGGGFESLPSGLRLIYLGFSVFMIWQLLYANRLINLATPWSSRTNRTVGFLIALSVFSALINAISRSPVERWNAIPALMVALGFYLLRRSSKQN